MFSVYLKKVHFPYCFVKQLITRCAVAFAERVTLRVKTCTHENITAWLKFSFENVAIMIQVENIKNFCQMKNSFIAHTENHFIKIHKKPALHNVKG